MKSSASSSCRTARWFVLLFMLLIQVVGQPVYAQEDEQEDEIVSLFEQAEKFSALGTKEGNQRAIDFYRQALAIGRDVGDRSGEATILSNIGVVHYGRGSPDSALVYYREALAIKREVDDRSWEATILSSIGVVHGGRLGRPDSALVYFHEALAIEREVGDWSGEATSLNNIGLVHVELGSPDLALMYFAMAFDREVGDRTREATNLNIIGEVLVEIGSPDLALVYYRKALAIDREVGDRTGEATSLNNIGFVHARRGRPDSALVYYREALAIRREVGDRSGEAETLINLGIAHRSLGKLELALAYLDSGAVLNATLSRYAGSDPNRLSFTEQFVDVYAYWPLTWLARADDPDIDQQTAVFAALAAAERGRAQALLDLMRKTTTEYRAGADLAHEGADLASVVREANAAAGLSYLATSDTLLIWLIRPSGETHVFRQPISRDTLVAQIQALRLMVDQEEDHDNILDAATTIAQAVMPNALRQLMPSSGELLILPQGPLNLVPFATLPLDGEGTDFLGSRYALRYAPSLSTLRQVEGKAGLDNGPERARVLSEALVVANPTMPVFDFLGIKNYQPAPLAGAGAASVRIVARLGVEPVDGDSATEQAVRRHMAKAPLVHLATHGYAYQSEAEVSRSFIVLASSENEKAHPDRSDGLMTVGEILDATPRLNAELVSLWACQTGLGDVKATEGTVGFQRAFLAKGARSVLVSLWNVPEEATAVLMESFYWHWLEDGVTKAEALRQAQEEVRKRWPHPRYWAAFQVAGAQ